MSYLAAIFLFPLITLTLAAGGGPLAAKPHQLALLPVRAWRALCKRGDVDWVEVRRS